MKENFETVQDLIDDLKDQPPESKIQFTYIDKDGDHLELYIYKSVQSADDKYVFMYLSE